MSQGAHFAPKSNPIALASSKNPESTTNSIFSGVHCGSNQKKACGFTKCKTPLAKKAKITIQLPTDLLRINV